MAIGQGRARALSYDPGADALARYPDWVIRHRPLHGVPELMCRRRRVILLDDSNSTEGRRCSLAHAVAHIDLDHQASPGLISVRQEVAADRLAARRLVDIRLLADAWMWSETLDEIASELEVDPHFLSVRLRTLHPSERHYLLRRIERKVMCA